ncbi:MAG: Rieske (2Fe-2S) protein [Planctomycetaceae bacterium]
MHAPVRIPACELLPMSDFQTVAKTGDIPEGQGRCFNVSGTMVGVFLHQGRYLAINDFCPHMGASLSDGHVTETGAVMCPWHAWCFSLQDGTWLDNSRSGIKTETYEVRVQDGEIQVRVPDPGQPRIPPTSVAT